MADSGTGSAPQLIDLVKSGDHDGLARALRAGAPVAVRDGDDWSALDWAAGRGDETAIGLLLEHGADPTATGADLRRPYQVALAAGHLGAARVLREAEQRIAGADPEQYRWRPYCKAYTLSQLRAFTRWSEVSSDDGTRPDDEVVFVHDDLTVTESMWRDQGVLVAEISADWAAFCERELKFLVPDDFDLVPPGPATPD